MYREVRRNGVRLEVMEGKILQRELILRAEFVNIEKWEANDKPNKLG
jgi:hypothetical protein